MNKLQKSKPFVYKEQLLSKRAREQELISKECLLVATTQGGAIATEEVDSGDSDGLAGQPMGLLLALTYAT